MEASFYVLINHTLEGFDLNQDLPSFNILRLIPEIRHLNFVFRVRNNEYDRLRMPWHFIQSVTKCQTNPLHLNIKLYETKWTSPAFQAALPVQYFPNFDGQITVKFADRKDRHNFVSSLKHDGLVLKTKVAHQYVPQSLEYKWIFMVIPLLAKNEGIVGNDQDDKEVEEKQARRIGREVEAPMVHPLMPDEELREFLEWQKFQEEPDEYDFLDEEDSYEEDSYEDDSIEDEEEYFTAVDEESDNLAESEESYYTAEEEDDYKVVDEVESDLNYPQIVFECGLDRSAIRPLESDCKADRVPPPTEDNSTCLGGCLFDILFNYC